MTTFAVTIPEIETERLILRPLSLDDFDALATFYASERSKFVGGPVSKAEAWRKLAFINGHWMLRGYGYWAIQAKEDAKDTGTCLGLCGFIFREGWSEPELGWQLFEAAEGKGIAFEAATAARAYGAAHFGLDGVISHIAPDNTRSAALATRLGAHIERRGELLGEICDIYRHPMIGADVPAEVEA